VDNASVLAKALRAVDLEVADKAGEGKGNAIAADEFSEMGARYIGAPSPACVPFVSRPLDVSGRGGGGTVDKFGDNLITACTTGHHDASFRHNPLRDAQTARTTETTRCMSGLSGWHKRRRHGAVGDRRWLYLLFGLASRRVHTRLAPGYESGVWVNHELPQGRIAIE
jgi:hypothetical protein